MSRLRYLVVLLILVAVLAGAFFWLNSYIYDEKQEGVADYRAISVILEGRPVSVGSEGVAYFGNDAKGDVNDDGIPDLAFVITQQGGGSGTFYYAVAALQNVAGRYHGTNAILLGDRIAPQSTEIRNGILIVNYADRKPEEPFSSQPSIAKSLYGYYDGIELISVPPTGPISIEGRMVCLPASTRGNETQGEPQTMECAYGLQDDQGRYFALSDTDPEYKNISGAPMNERVKVEGTFKLQLGSKYEDIGIIEVTHITKL